MCPTLSFNQVHRKNCFSNRSLMMTNHFAIPFLTLLILAAAVATPLSESLADTGSDDATMTELAALAAMLSVNTPSGASQAAQPNPVAQVDDQTAVHAETAAAKPSATDDSVLTPAGLSADQKVTESGELEVAKEPHEVHDESDDDDDDVMDGGVPALQCNKCLKPCLMC